MELSLSHSPLTPCSRFTEDMYPALEDDRMSEFTNGSLKIEQVQLEDAGNFTCVAENDQNNVSITASLLVKGGNWVTGIYQATMVTWKNHNKEQLFVRQDEKEVIMDQWGRVMVKNRCPSP